MQMSANLDVISEDYYQISEAILDSFPKYHPPLDLFIYNENIKQLVTFVKKGTRLSNEQVENIHQLCLEGDVFVSRADHAVYSKHIAKQLDLILVDSNLKESEISEICLEALPIRLNDFFEQPVKAVFEKLYADSMVVTEYLWADLHRLKSFMRRLFHEEFTLSRHSTNSLFVGLWLLTNTKNSISRKEFDQAALALLLHDVGMSKVPAFITGKPGPLKPEEYGKILQHPMAGNKIAHKFDLDFDSIKQSTLEHHERLDGSGYPQKSNTLSPFGRLTAVVDAFSAMIQTRPYAQAKELIPALKELTAMPKLFDLTYSGALLSAFVSENFGKLDQVQGGK